MKFIIKKDIVEGNEHSKQYKMNKNSKIDFLQMLRDRGINDVIDISNLSVHHIDDTKGEDRLKNNDISNLWFIGSSPNMDYRDREVVHKIIHFMMRHNIAYDDLLDSIESMHIYRYDEKTNSIEDKRLSELLSR